MYRRDVDKEVCTYSTECKGKKKKESRKGEEEREEGQTIKEERRERRRKQGSHHSISRNERVTGELPFLVGKFTVYC